MADYTNADPFSDIDRAQGLARQSVLGYGQALQPGLRRTIGTAIGGLNSIGALRSGGTVQALNDIGTDYGNQIGAYADQATLGAMGYGLGANANRLRNEEFQYQQDQDARARRGSFLRAIGGVLGAGLGFVTGGASAAVPGGLGGLANGTTAPGVGAYNGYTGGY